jgi:beta-lactamase class A
VSKKHDKQNPPGAPQTKSNSRQKTLLSVVAVVALAAGGLAGWYGRINYDSNSPVKLDEVREMQSEYHFIDPLLYVDNQREAPQYDALNNLLKNDVNAATKSGNAQDVSIYFRDMKSGLWTGINENETYEPSSMLKVLVMMSYYKQSETDPSIMDKVLPYSPIVDPGQYYKPAHPLQAGNYTVHDLIQAMIIDSDNSAADLLNVGNDQAFYAAYNTLDLPPIPDISGNSNVTDYMSPKSYSSLFRTLYNATYLDRIDSEQALELLSRTTFTQGLVAGVPAGTTVAHKFGEHTVVDQTGQVVSRELHDCGIVYYKNPYFLCVMTKGTDFSKLQTVISGISKTVYDKVVLDNPS